MKSTEKEPVEPTSYARFALEKLKQALWPTLTTPNFFGRVTLTAHLENGRISRVEVNTSQTTKFSAT